jgi:hypothetical protein
MVDLEAGSKLKLDRELDASKLPAKQPRADP